jgi:hypothetical protein
MSVDLNALIKKHGKRGIVVDTNLLLLLFVGSFDKEGIESFKRTNEFTPRDFELLDGILSHFGTIITTPTILAETIAFCGSYPKSNKQDYYEHFATALQVYDEQYTASRDLAADANWYPFGLTDCAIIHLAMAKHLVITVDLKLWALLEKKGLDAINFNHWRLAFIEAVEG